MPNSEKFFNRAEALIKKIENLITPKSYDELDGYRAWIWKKNSEGGFLKGIKPANSISTKDLLNIEKQKKLLCRNTLQFVKELPANNVLLWGPRGTGKSSLIRAIFNDFSKYGLKIIEVDKRNLIDLPEITERISDLKGKFIIYCDDLSFDADDDTYRTLKTVLDGSLSAQEKFLIYATSNRRHLVPESSSENQFTEIVGNELHHAEGIEEKISLSERFGLWLSFHPLSQDSYIKIAKHWIKHFEPDLTSSELESCEHSALQWALLRGSRSGRTAFQFAKDWVGQRKLK